MILEKLLHKKFIITLLLVIFVIGGIIFVFRSKIFAEKKVHYHAGFMVFQNGKKVDFSDFKYMYEKPCTINGKENEENENDQLEKAHLHDRVGDVVHSERSGATWKDLFTNIHYSINYTQTSGYINGNKVDNYQNHPINPDDSLVVFIGTNDIQNSLKQAPSREYIEQMGKKSKTCGD